MRSAENSTNRLNQSGKLVASGYWLLLAIWVAALALIVNKHQSISDWWRLRGYNPPAAILQLANQDTMTSYTRHMFYLNRPQLLPTVTSFRQYCPENEDTIVLGCYHTGQNGIFIYNVQDPTLAGVQQVTAAHEVLHAVYARLSSSARNTLDQELESFYEHGLSDQRVLAEVKIYQQTEPGQVYDEMSCTFGTELANLPADLSAYYKPYFTNRQAIVNYEQQYQQEFTSRETTIDQYDSQLASLKSQIDGDEASLQSQLNNINAQESQLESERASNVDAYNAAVPNYNNLVNSYNAEVSTTENLITQYNQLVVTRNQVAGELTTLDKALDTRLTQKD